MIGRARRWLRAGRSSIAGRLILLALAPAMLMLVLANLLLYTLTMRDAAADAQERGELLARTLAEGSRYGVVSGNTGNIEDNARAILLADPSVVHIEVLDAGRRQLLVQARPVLPADKLTHEAPILAQPLKIDIFDAGAGAGAGADATPVVPKVAGAGGPTAQGTALGLVRVSVSPQPMLRARARQLGLATLAVILAASISALVGVALAGRLREPLTRVLSGMRDIRAGRFDSLHAPTAPGELGELQDALQDMAHGLQLTQHRLEAEVALRTAALREAMERVREADAEKGKLIAWSNQLVEDERRRISVEVHDDLSATLVSVRMLADAMASTARGSGQTELAANAARIAELIDQTYQRARDIVRRLRPEILDALGLPGAAQEVVRHFDQMGGPCRFRFELLAELPVLHETIAITAYRVLQEALSNVAKHADATLCQVSLGTGLDGRQVVLTVADNGRGFDPLARQAGLGLVGMRERLAPLGGALVLDAAPGQGTVLRVALPLSEATAIAGRGG